MRVSGDFDGDSKTDKAIASFCGSSYRIEVHLSTKRLHVRLTVPIHNEVGLELVAYDVDHDRRADLILISASSVKPIAVWLNKGNGAFERRSGSFGPFFGTDGGPRFRRGTPPRSDAQAIISTDDPADDLETAKDFAFELESSLIKAYAEQSPPIPAESGSASPRGPPITLPSPSARG